MPRTSQTKEARALRFSLIISLAVSAIAVVWGLAVNSQVILFDGVFTLLGAALTGMSILAGRLATRDPSPRFPFGLEAVVPLAVGIQGLALLGTIAYASLEAVRTIRDGGSEVAAGAVAAYGALTAVVALAGWLWLRKVDPDSDLLDAEARGWLAGLVLSAVVLAGALVALGLRGLGLHGIEPFVDPVLVLVACALLLAVPVGMIKTMLVELLEGAPEPHLVGTVADAVGTVRREFGLPEPILRVSKLGRKLYVEADFIVDDGWLVADEDKVRRAVKGALADQPYDLWLNVELTTDSELVA